MRTVAFAEIWWEVLLLIIGSYLVGNINFALIISKLCRSDIRTQGSGNPGTMNMLRNYGLKLGLLTLILDVLKGFLPTMVGSLLFSRIQSSSGICWGELMQYVAGFSTVIGHVFPIFLKFKGGKGIASTIGIFMWVQPLVTIGMFFVIVLYIWRFEYGSVGSLIIVTVMSLLELILNAIKYSKQFSPELCVLFLILFLLCFLTYYAHRENIARLLMGKENRTKLKQMLHKHIKKKDSVIAREKFSIDDRNQPLHEDRQNTAKDGNNLNGLVLNHTDNLVVNGTESNDKKDNAETNDSHMPK